MHGMSKKEQPRRCYSLSLARQVKMTLQSFSEPANESDSNTVDILAIKWVEIVLSHVYGPILVFFILFRSSAS